MSRQKAVSFQTTVGQLGVGFQVYVVRCTSETGDAACLHVGGAHADPFEAMSNASKLNRLLAGASHDSIHRNLDVSEAA